MRTLGHRFPIHEHPELLVGLNKADDAAVYQLNADQAIVQTLDFFAPTVDDPYSYGAIAATNALNDVYAMNADVLFALNIAAFPEDLPVDVVAAVLEGGADKVLEAGGAIAGGHTIIDAEPKYGLCVTGLAHPDAIRRNATAQPGDAVVLTKPLGTGVMINAIREGHASRQDAEAAVALMMTLNKAAMEASREVDVHALTDVTGFGLAGHLTEIATNSDAGVEVSLSALPALPNLAQYAALGLDTVGQGRNQAFFGRQLELPGDLSLLETTLLFDPQTAGGMLIVVAEPDAAALRRRLDEVGTPNWQVGQVTAGDGVGVIR